MKNFRAILAFLLIFSAISILSGCGGEQVSTAPTGAPTHVESIRLDTPTAAPTPEPEQITVYSTLEQVSTLSEFGRSFVDPLLAIHSGWSAAEDIGAEEFGRFFVSLGDERRGYSLDAYFVAEEDAYRVPSDRFCETLRQFFDVGSEHLLSLPLYDAENEVFVLPAESYVSYYGEVYRVEESDDELRVRYLLYAANPVGNYFESTGSCYELLIEKGESTYVWRSSTPVTESSTIPAPQNGEMYLNTEIASFYLRRGMTAEIVESEGNFTLVRYTGAWSGLERFDRTTGKVSPVVYFSPDDSGHDLLVSPPFGEFNTAEMSSCELRENGEVRLLVRGIRDSSFGQRFPRVYTWSEGVFDYEIYSAPVGTTETVGAGGRGSLYDVIVGEGSIAFLFDTETTPAIRVSSSAGSISLKFIGVSLSEELELVGAGGNYTIASVTQIGEDTLITLLPATNISRFRMRSYEPVAGELPYISLELLGSANDYPLGW